MAERPIKDQTAADLAILVRQATSVLQTARELQQEYASVRGELRDQLAVSMAEKIVDTIMFNGTEQADRLVLTSAQGRDLGGWERRALIDRIRRMLNQ